MLCGNPKRIEFFKKLKAQGRASPLDDKPEYEEPDFRWYLQAFLKLNRSRPLIPMSNYNTYIPLSAYTDFFQLFESLESVSFDTDVLMAFDAIFVKKSNENKKRDN